MDAERPWHLTETILKALESVIDPELHKPVTELDMVRDVVVHPDGSVEVDGGADGRRLSDAVVEDQVQRFVGAVEGVTAVKLHFDVMSPDEKEVGPSTRLRGGRPEKTISLSLTTRVVAIASARVGSASRR